MPHDSIIFNKAEIDAYRWVSVEDMLALIEKQRIIEYSQQDFEKYPFEFQY